ncbi:MAG: hypothetical protein J7494_08185 [Sphingobium sp.]|nr:hypothetical protein [Sphingobium sp.]
MTKTFIALTATLALAVASPAFAKEAEKSSFTHEGVTYTYTKTQVGKSTVIEGYAQPGQKFHLVKNGNQVTGTANGIPVSFSMDEVAKTAKTTTLASR